MLQIQFVLKFFPKTHNVFMTTPQPPLLRTCITL